MEPGGGAGTDGRQGTATLRSLALRPALRAGAGWAALTRLSMMFEQSGADAPHSTWAGRLGLSGERAQRHASPSRIQSLSALSTQHSEPRTSFPQSSVLVRPRGGDGGRGSEADASAPPAAVR